MRNQQLICALALFGRLVVAGRAAGLAVHKAVSAKADIKDALAQATVLLAFATFFRLLALGAAEFRRAHEANVACKGWHSKRDGGNDWGLGIRD